MTGQITPEQNPQQCSLVFIMKWSIIGIIIYPGFEIKILNERSQTTNDFNKSGKLNLN